MSVLDDHIDELIERPYKKTERVSTITGKPEMVFTGGGTQGASFASHLKAGFVDDPITKAKIYSANRFPNLTEKERMDRYFIVKGQVVYEGDDGKYYLEDPDWNFAVGKFLADVVANAPAEVMGAMGAMAGPGTAAIGAAGGEGIRKAIGALAFGEPQTKSQNVIDMAVMGGTAFLGEQVGKYAVKGYNRLRNIPAPRVAKRTARVAGKQFRDINLKKAFKTQQYYKDKFGVDLFSGQSAESRRLLDRINLYGDIPQTADLVQAAKRIQDEQAYNAVQRYWDDLYGDLDRVYSGGKLSKAANASIEKEISRRAARAKPFYDKAFKSGVKVDIRPHIQAVDDMIGQWPLNSSERRKLQGLKDMMFREVRTKTPDGETIIAQTPENRIEVLDKLKKSIDAYLIPKANEPAVDRQVKRDIREIKNRILSDMDKASPAYAKARQLWADDSDAITLLTNKTLLTDLANLEGDKVVNASRKLFNAAQSSPEIVSKIRNRIINEDPAAWNAALRTYLQDLFEKTSQDVSGNAAKVFNAFYRNTIGTPSQKKILKAAMTKQQFSNLEDLTDMLRRVGMVVRKESTTATRQMATEEIENEAFGFGGISRTLRLVAHPMYTKRRLIAEKLNDFMTEKAQRLVSDALVNPATTKHLQKIKHLSLNTEKGVKAATTLMSLILGGHFSRKWEEPETPFGATLQAIGQGR